MRSLEALIAVVAALCALNVSALSSYMDLCKDQPRVDDYGDDPVDIHLFCGQQPHGNDPIIWLGGNRTNFLIIECLKQTDNYTCEDIPEFDFGHNDTIKELRFSGCPMSFLSIACLERRLGVRGALKLTVQYPQGDSKWLREDMERLRGFRWISLDVTGEDVTITKEALAPLSALERLDLAYMRLHLAPGALAVLRALTHLEIKYVNLRDSDLTSGVLANIPALTDLNLSVNSLLNITYDTFQNLTSLEKLDVSVNEISSLDGAVLAAGCPRLRELKATFNPLVGLRPLEHLQHLEKLDISENTAQMLELFPRALSALPQLVHVDIKRCNVHTLPADLLVGSKSLLTLDLSNNLLRTLPASLFSDQHMLQELDLSSNKLETLPQDIFSGLIGLQRLELSNNKLRTLPSSLFTDQRELQKLHLSYNEFETLPQELFSGLARLQHLELYKNHLRTLPASLFTDQRMLQNLYLGYNEFETLPQELFYGLEGLQNLELLNNQLRSLPASLFTNQRMLQELNLCNNELETLPQELFSSLSGLQRLIFCNNRLRMLPESLFTNKSMLQEIVLSFNELETLPQKFSSLVGLQRLDLGNNLLKKLPDQFLEGLPVQMVDLSENPLRCDCYLYQLALRTRESGGNGTLPRITVLANCTDPVSLRKRPLSSVDLHDLTCAIPAQFCAPGCRCFKHGSPLHVVMYCITRFDPLPQQFSKLPFELKLWYAPPSLSWIPSTVQTLDLSGLNMEEVPTGLNLSAIKDLDLSGNGLTRVPVEILAANVTVKLARNPLACLACDCWHADGIRQLQLASALVKDYEELVCSDGLRVRQVDVQTLCPQLALCDWWGIHC